MSLNIIKHPILEHKLSFLRDINTKSDEFRRIAKDLSKLLTYEAMRNWTDVSPTSIETPLSSAQVERIGNPPVIVGIMRAGIPFMEAALEIIPFASAGHIGIYRDKFINNTVEYYFKLPPNVEERPILLCDPLIATADTMMASLERLENYKVGKIRVLALLVHTKAAERLLKHYPDIEIYALSEEREINEKAYLVPGLGDAGDRLYGTI